jgi:hypothetical protein
MKQKLKTTEEICVNCKFWEWESIPGDEDNKQNEGPHSWVELSHGYCHRNPPTITGMEADGFFATSFPGVYGNEWCGEFQPLPLDEIRWFDAPDAKLPNDE